MPLRRRYSLSRTVECPACNGWGETAGRTCRACDGMGEVPRREARTIAATDHGYSPRREHGLSARQLGVGGGR